MYVKTLNDVHFKMEGVVYKMSNLSQLLFLYYQLF